ncbi:MAG: hypothetical protein GY765_41950, partial [bacterium]|nr:hypothetical protein [bacterium]
MDSVVFYDAVYPGGLPVTETSPGDTVYIRSVVSDPFGAFDITGADLTLSGPGGISVNASMDAVDSVGAVKTYEYAYRITPDSSVGFWQAEVTAYEGGEGTIEHSGVGILESVTGNPPV